MTLSIKIKPLILVGSQGSGRAAISFHLLKKFPNKFQRAISHTTRKPKQSQKQGEHYYFTDDKFVTENTQKFVTLTKSSNAHFYGLLGDQIMRVINDNKIPIFKMTLQAYKSNVSKDGSLQIKQGPLPSVEKIANALFKTTPSYFTRNKSIECNALYISVPDLKELQHRLKCSPIDPKQQSHRIERAKKQQQQSAKYFDDKDIIKSEAEKMDETMRDVQSRLFQLY